MSLSSVSAFTLIVFGVLLVHGEVAPIANVTAPGLAPLAGPQSQPDLLSPYIGSQPPAPEEAADVPPSQPQSACNVTRTIIQSMNAFNPNISLVLFSRDAVVNAADSNNDFVVMARGKKRIGGLMRANLMFFGLFGPVNFTIVQTPVDEANRCMAVVKLFSELLKRCPGATNSSVYAVLDVRTENGLIKSLNRTMDSMQHHLIEECISQKLNRLGGSLNFGNE